MTDPLARIAFLLAARRTPEPSEEHMRRVRDARASRGAHRFASLLRTAQESPLGRNDVDRVCALPISLPMEHRCAEWSDPKLIKCPVHHLSACPDTEASAWSEDHVLSDAFRRGFRLWEPQCRSLRDWSAVGGLLAPVGVGFGKTLITQMIAQHDITNGHAERVLLTIPSAVYPQLMSRDFAFARRAVPFTIPVFGLGNMARGKRMSKAKKRRPGLYILPHSLFSVEDTEEMLRIIDPDTVIVDECHAFVNRSSARTKRFLRFMLQHERRAAFLSGTITKKSINDYVSHLTLALGQSAPLPTSARMAADWAEVLDADAPQRIVSAGPLEPLRQWARTHFPNSSERITPNRAGFRRAYQLRLVHTPGVVATGDNEIGVALTLANVSNDVRHSPELETLIRAVEDDQLTPNGDEIEYPIHAFKWRYELYTTGGFNQLRWPEPKDEKHAEQIQLAQWAHREHNTYARSLREFLSETHIEGLDSPFLVGNHFMQASAHGATLRAPYDLLALWLAWKKAVDLAGGKDEIVERESSYIRVCPTKAEHVVGMVAQAVRDAKGRRDRMGTLVWVHHKGFAAWIFELLRSVHGDLVWHCPAGPVQSARIIQPDAADHIVVASIMGHGTGKNLQEFGNAILAQVPRDAATMEQTLGRTHRNGQERDELRVLMGVSSEFEKLSFGAMLNDSLYTQQTTGAPRRVIQARYDPPPVTFPSAILRERGLVDAKHLTPEMEKERMRRFG